MSAQLYNLSPATIADRAFADGPNFILSGQEWIAIQTYVTDALALPTTDETFRNSLGKGAPADLSDFKRLVAAYSAINTHVTTWEKTIYPATVALASDVYQYGMNKAPSFYPPILKEAQILEQNPGDEAAKGALKAILDNLKADAQGRADKAAAVEKQITQFADDTAQDRTALVGPDGKSGLVSYYNDKYGSASADVVELNKQIVQQAGVLKAANDEYNHDVIVAATSPTYAWIWPLGTIAAAVVAGVYGKRATDALDAARAAQAKINALAASLAADANLMVAINSAQFGLNRIVADVAGALPVVQKIRGVWGGLSSDLASISQLIDDDIRNVPPIIMNLGVDEALKAWHNVALNADAYRVNAYVTPAPGALTMEAWQVANQFSSTRILAA